MNPVVTIELYRRGTDGKSIGAPVSTKTFTGNGEYKYPTWFNKINSPGGVNFVVKTQNASNVYVYDQFFNNCSEGIDSDGYCKGHHADTTPGTNNVRSGIYWEREGK